MRDLRDNTRYLLDEREEISLYRQIANHTVEAISEKAGSNLLVFPFSFKDCKDKIGEQCLMELWPQGESYLLRTGNLAGFIGIDGQSISIRSRFSEKDGEEDFFLHYMLQKVLSVNLFNLKHTTSPEQALDFLLYLFPPFLNAALSQGLYKEYKRNEYNDSRIKGRIDVGKQIRMNLPFNGRVAYRVHEYDHDNRITQLVRHTIEYIRSRGIGRKLLRSDEETKMNVAKIVQATATYQKQDRRQVVWENLKNISHPYFTHYAPLQKLCIRILRHERLKYGKDPNELFGILFDVSWLWEEYLAGLLKPHGFKHPDNRWNKGGIYLGMEMEKRTNAFLRYPDFYDKEPDGIVIDAKYKTEINEVTDINQMISYLFRLKGHIGIFILPTRFDSSSTTYQLKGYGTRHNMLLQKYPFQIPANISSYKEFEREMEKSERQLKENIQALQTTQKGFIPS